MFTPNYSRAADGRFTTGGFTQAQINEMTKEAGRKLYAELLRLDPEGGEAWFDDEANVPARCTPAEINNILRAQIAYLKEQAEIRAALDEAKREMQETRLEQLERCDKAVNFVASRPLADISHWREGNRIAAVILAAQIVNHLDA